VAAEITRPVTRPYEASVGSSVSDTDSSRCAYYAVQTVSQNTTTLLTTTVPAMSLYIQPLTRDSPSRRSYFTFSRVT
jgi:hypothetical protein